MITPVEPTRVLVSNNGNVKVYNLVDAEGNIVGSATEQLLDTNEINRLTILKNAKTALGNNITYLGVTSPTNAQVVAQVKALTRQVNGLIRLTINQLDGNEG